MDCGWHAYLTIEKTIKACDKESLERSEEVRRVGPQCELPDRLVQRCIGHRYQIRYPKERKQHHGCSDGFPVSTQIHFHPSPCHFSFGRTESLKRAKNAWWRSRFETFGIVNYYSCIRAYFCWESCRSQSSPIWFWDWRDINLLTVLVQFHWCDSVVVWR